MKGQRRRQRRARRRAQLAALAALVLLVLGAGCPSMTRPPATDCVPNETRCGPDGRPEACSPSHRWYATADEACPEATRCCLSRSPDTDQLIHTCDRPDRCVPEEMRQVRDPLLEPAEDAGEEGR